MKYIVALTLTLLYLTRPSDVIETCEKINQPEYCQILNAE